MGKELPDAGIGSKQREKERLEREQRFVEQYGTELGKTAIQSLRLEEHKEQTIDASSQPKRP